MFGTDHLFGSFEFPTDLQKVPDKQLWRASAMGISAEHRDRDQAINDLNQKLETAVIQGKLVPNMG